MDMPVDPNEPTYCLCQQVSYGEMIGYEMLLCIISSRVLVSWFILVYSGVLVSWSLDIIILYQYISIILSTGATTKIAQLNGSTLAAWDSSQNQKAAGTAQNAQLCSRSRNKDPLSRLCRKITRIWSRKLCPKCTTMTKKQK